MLIMYVTWLNTLQFYLIWSSHCEVDTVILFWFINKDIEA